MQIADVRCLLASAPYATAGDAERVYHLQTGYRPAAFIRVETDEGITGLGETYAGVYAPEAVAALVGQFASDLRGQAALATRALTERMQLACGYWGRMGLSQSVLGGIEMALWDLKGKALGVPTCELLGGKAHEALPVYASGGNDKPYDALAKEMASYVEAGYRAVKVRINNLPEEKIVEKVARCREALGDGVELAVDAAQGLARRPWPVKKALRIARKLEPYNLLWIEEPAGVTRYGDFAAIRRQARTSVAGGETVTSLAEAEAYLNADALDLFQPDASLIGGIEAFRRVAQMAERRGVEVAAHVWCGGVGMMGNFHAAFTAPNCTVLELPSVPNPLRDDVLAEPLVIEDGKIRLPDVPGLGVRLPEGFEEEYPYRPGSVYRILGAEAELATSSVDWVPERG